MPDTATSSTPDRVNEKPLGNPNFSPRAQRDFELVCKAVEGDQLAFGRLMENHRDAINFMMLRIVHNRDDAEDLTIEAFGKAFNNIHKYTPDYAFSTWLYTIAKHNAIDFMRKKRLETLSIDEEPHEDSGNSYAESIKATTLDPEEAYIKDQRAKLMRDVTEKISPKYRRLIELRFFKEYSYDEIAKELDLPLGTVKAQLFRAKELLHNILKASRHKF